MLRMEKWMGNKTNLEHAQIGVFCIDISNFCIHFSSFDFDAIRFVALCADIWRRRRRRRRDGKWYMIELVQRLQFHFHFHLSAYFEIKIRPYGHMHTAIESFPHQ